MKELNQETADAIIERIREITPANCPRGEIIDYINSLVAEDEQKHGCLFCSDPDCYNECIKETDEEISLRKWEEFLKEIKVGKHTALHPQCFPDWLKEQ